MISIRQTSRVLKKTEISQAGELKGRHQTGIKHSFIGGLIVNKPPAQLAGKGMVFEMRSVRAALSSHCRQLDRLHHAFPAATAPQPS